MSSLTTTHEMNDQSKTEIRQFSLILVHPHPPDRFHIHYFFSVASSPAHVESRMFGEHWT